MEVYVPTIGCYTAETWMTRPLPLNSASLKPHGKAGSWIIYDTDSPRTMNFLHHMDRTLPSPEGMLPPGSDFGPQFPGPMATKERICLTRGPAPQCCIPHGNNILFLHPRPPGRKGYRNCTASECCSPLGVIWIKFYFPLEGQFSPWKQITLSLLPLKLLEDLTFPWKFLIRFPLETQVTTFPWRTCSLWITFASGKSFCFPPGSCNITGLLFKICVFYFCSV